MDLAQCSDERSYLVPNIRCKCKQEVTRENALSLSSRTCGWKQRVRERASAEKRGGWDVEEKK